MVLWFSFFDVSSSFVKLTRETRFVLQILEFSSKESTCNQNVLFIMSFVNRFGH